MAERIQKVTRGQAPSLVNADLGNAVIDTCNAFRNMEVYGALFAFNGDRATLVIDAAKAGGATVNYPFAVRVAGQGEVAVRAGKVNGVMPEINAVPLTDSPKLPVAQSGIIYLRAAMDDEFNLVSVEVLAGVELPEPDCYHPAIAIADVERTDDPDTGAIVLRLRQGVFSDLQLIRFYADYVWVPTGGGNSQ